MNAIQLLDFIRKSRNIGYVLAPRNRNMLNKPVNEHYCKRIIIHQISEDDYFVTPACYTSKSYIDPDIMSELLELLEQTKKDIQTINDDN